MTTTQLVALLEICREFGEHAGKHGVPSETYINPFTGKTEDNKVFVSVKHLKALVGEQNAKDD